MIIGFINDRAIFKMGMVERVPVSFPLTGHLSSELWLFARNDCANVIISFPTED